MPLQFLKDEVTRFRNRDLMEGVVAGCLLVMTANGVLKAQEKQKMIDFFQATDDLKVFDIDHVIRVFEAYTEKFTADFAIGEAEVLQAVAKGGKDPEDARLLVRVCCAIGAADGQFEDAEKRVIRQICNELGLDASDFGL